MTTLEFIFLYLILPAIVGYVIWGLLGSVAQRIKGAFRRLTFQELSIRPMERKIDRGRSEIILKLTYASAERLIIEGLSIKSRFSPADWSHGFLLWPHVIKSFFTPSTDTGMVKLMPSQKSAERKRPRKLVSAINFLGGSISAFSGIVYILLFVTAIIDPFLWPLLFLGPMGEFELTAADDAIRINDTTTKQKLRVPFMVESPGERFIRISYRPLFTEKRKLFRPGTQFVYVKEASHLRIFNLPNRYKFVWKGKEALRIRIRGKWRDYPIDIGTTFVSIATPKNTDEQNQKLQSSKDL